MASLCEPQIGRILPNFIADTWGSYNCVLVCNFVCIVLMFSTLAATDAPGIIAICALYGLFSGACTYVAVSGTLKLIDP